MFWVKFYHIRFGSVSKWWWNFCNFFVRFLRISCNFCLNFQVPINLESLKNSLDRTYGHSPHHWNKHFILCNYFLNNFSISFILIPSEWSLFVRNRVEKSAKNLKYCEKLWKNLKYWICGKMGKFHFLFYCFLLLIRVNWILCLPTHYLGTNIDSHKIVSNSFQMFLTIFFRFVGGLGSVH